MITGNIDIHEIETDGPPEEAGTYLFWLLGEGMIFAMIDETDLDDFEENYNGISWTFGDYEVIAYCNQEHLELGYI